jgi:hypothetical protein
LFVSSDVKLINADVNATAGQSLTPIFYKRDGTSVADLSGQQVALSDIARVAIRDSSPNADIEASVALTLIRNSVVFPLELPSVTIVKGAAETRVVQINLAGADVNLKQHLMDNQLYYSQAVFRSLDGAALAGVLANLSMNLNGQAVPVAQAVDPIPLRVVGNFLAFKISSDPAADEEWKSFLDRRGIAIGQAKVEFVPLSSGGVFAEAVLGRSNSAEKLDITRFWNWQDSPIPIVPSDIAPVDAASRAQSDAAIAPGQLSAPIVSIQQPTALPDPSAAFAATIAAIQNGNMFRDMSGMSEVVKLAQSAIQASSAGATAAGQQASSNEQNAVNAAADIFKANLAASGNKNTAADKNASQQGALINEQDKRKGGAIGGGFASAGGAVSGSNGSGGTTAGKTGAGSSTVSGGGSGAAFAPSTSSGNPALDVATFGPEGKPFDEAIRSALGTPADGQFELASYTEAAKLDALRNWKNLLLFKVPNDIRDALAARNMQIQYAHEESFSDDLNFDLYPVRIDRFPTVNNAVLSSAQLVKYVRLHINDLLDAAISLFHPYNSTDGQIYASDNPLKAVMKIDIFPDNAAVVVSAATPTGWTFTTVTTPDTGRHPVSGHRNFFMGEREGINYLINKGLDMTSTGVAGLGFPLAGEYGYGKADVLWRSLQDGVVAFVNANGGSAIKEKPFSERVEWQLVYRQWQIPLEKVFGPGAGSPGGSGFVTI